MPAEATELAGAVIPVAGLGTRLLPLTRAVPKELLPLAGLPVVEHVARELREAGLERLCLVTRRGKGAIEDHLDDPRVVAVRQPHPRGLGDAVLCAEPFCDGRPFFLALGDCVYRSARVARALIDAFGATPGAAALLAVERVPRERLASYGVVAIEAGRVTALVEKPAPAAAPSDLAIAARYILTPAIFDALRAGAPDASGELQLTAALERLVAAGAHVVAVELPAGERRYDIGTPAAYAEAFVELALAERPELWERLVADRAR